MKNKLSIFLLLAMGLGTIPVVNAATYPNVDELKDSDTLTNSGEATELNWAEEVTGQTLVQDQKNNSVTVHNNGILNGEQSWYIDFGSDSPDFVLLKFGVKKKSGLPNHYLFKNISDLTKLVFTSSQVNNLIKLKCKDACGDTALSHFTSYNAVPIPATFWLFGSAFGVLAPFLGKKRRQNHSGNIDRMALSV